MGINTEMISLALALNLPSLRNIGPPVLFEYKKLRTTMRPALLYLNKLMKREEVYTTIGYHDYEALDQTISKSIVPEIK